MTPRRVAAAVASVAALGSVTVSALALSSDSTRIVPSLNRGGLAAKGNRDLGAVPDTTGAIGPRHYLEAVNTRIALFGTRSLQLVTARNAYDFWGFARTAGSIEDPYVVWDDGAHRWYYTSLFTGASGNRVLFAWTKAGDPPNLSTAWCRTSISSGKFIDDFPHLGFSRNWIVISTNVATRDHELVSARVIVLAKPAGESCKRPEVKSFGNKAKPLHRADGHLAITLIPVSPVRPGSRAYVVSADCVYDPEPGKEYDPCGTRKRRTANQITIWSVEGPRAAPRLTRQGGVDVPSYRLPSPAPQRGVKAKLDTSDTRLYQAVSAPDRGRGVRAAIWTQHTVAGRGGRSEVRWYELDPRRLTLVRRGTIRSPRDWLFSAAISPTAHGDRAVIHYVASGPRRLPELLARSRGPDTRSDSMRDEVLVARSVSPYRCGLGPGEACPWGDYATATPDIWHPGLVWGSNEVMGSAKQQGPAGTHWLTRNFAINPG